LILPYSPFDDGGELPPVIFDLILKICDPRFPGFVRCSIALENSKQGAQMFLGLSQRGFAGAGR